MHQFHRQMWGGTRYAQVLDDGDTRRHISSMTKSSIDTPDEPGGDPQRVDIRTGQPAKGVVQKKGEIGGPKGPEPTRYGDWEVNGRCSDF